MITECKHCGYESTKLNSGDPCPNCQSDIMQESTFVIQKDKTQEELSNELFLLVKAENIKLQRELA